MAATNGNIPTTAPADEDALGLLGVTLAEDRADAEDIVFRPMEWSDLETMIEVFDLVWPQGPRLTGTPIGLLVARYLCLLYLENATWSNFAMTGNGELAGLTIVRVEGQNALFPQAHQARMEARDLILSTNGGQEALDILEAHFFPRERQLEKESDINNRAQAQLELFMVNPDIKGTGLGGELWTQMMCAFLRFGVKNYYLHTDSSCDFDFYEHKGLEQAASYMHGEDKADDGNSNAINDDQYIYLGTVQ